MSRVRLAVPVVVVTAALVAIAAPVDAQSSPQVPLIGAADADELALLLAEATEAQGICYGWRISLVDEWQGGSGDNVGSNAGAGTMAHRDCTRWIEFEASLHYTSNSSESADTASFVVHSNIEGAPDEGDLRRVGINGARMLGEGDDLAFIDAISSLPLLAAEHGLAPPVPLEANVDPIPEADRVTGDPGSDWTRKNGGWMTIAFFLLFLGGLWALLAFFVPQWMHHVWEAASDD